MKRFLFLSLAAFLTLGTFRAAGAAAPPCGSGLRSGSHMIPGPGEPGHDAALASKARRIDRQFHAFNAAPMAVTADATVDVRKTENRELIERFLTESDGWDFEAFSGGNSVYEVIDGWSKTAGLYAGAGIAADAFRYAVLRDDGEDCGEIEVARGQLLAGLDAMHMAFAIGGKPGVVARGFLKKNLPGMAQSLQTTPLFDDRGRPLPPVKNNGTWREDNSGLYPDYLWEDSVSRDMMLGWAWATAAAMEVARDDETVPVDVKARLRDDARSVGKALMRRTRNGFDLEFPDADGRTTFHGYLNENNVDGDYLTGLKNGFYAMMALGIFGADAYASDDPEAARYLREEMIGKRKLPDIAADHMKFINMGAGSNFSNYNMVFTAAWLAMRYVNDPAARARLVEALDRALYRGLETGPQPVEMKQSLFDFIYASAMTGETAYSDPTAPAEAEAVARGLQTLREYPEAPFWAAGRTNCDEIEVASGRCALDDGQTVNILGNVGWNDTLVADKPIPMAVRPPSNYYWRSNPYEPNGEGDGGQLVSAVDFRIAYWLGRWTRTIHPAAAREQPSASSAHSTSQP